jgi:hypothetical protein
LEKSDSKQKKTTKNSVDARSSVFNSTISLLASRKVEGSKLSMAAKEISMY